jgi:hypothetical protein
MTRPRDSGWLWLAGIAAVQAVGLYLGWVL